MHDPRIGRFFAVDPLTSEYPFYSPYAFSGNTVIAARELEGLEPVWHTAQEGDTYSSISQTYGVGSGTLQDINGYEPTQIPIGAKIYLGDPNSWQFPDDLQKWMAAGAEYNYADIASHPGILSDGPAGDLMEALASGKSTQGATGWIQAENSFQYAMAQGELQMTLDKQRSIVAGQMLFMEVQMKRAELMLSAEMTLMGLYGGAVFGGGSLLSTTGKTYLRNAVSKGLLDAAHQGLYLTLSDRSILEIDIINVGISAMQVPSFIGDYGKAAFDLNLKGEFGIKSMDRALIDYGMRRLFSAGKGYVGSNSYQLIGYDLLNKYSRNMVNNSYKK